ncbi:hypothetical protein L218DRAFT_497228 [Marasmius fiardii PR-910]|nr:hypothetical protein L218DRAFT_497228 [Marasmius fiardii PR-910]
MRHSRKIRLRENRRAWDFGFMTLTLVLPTGDSHQIYLSLMTRSPIDMCEGPCIVHHQLHLFLSFCLLRFAFTEVRPRCPCLVIGPSQFRFVAVPKTPFIFGNQLHVVLKLMHDASNWMSIRANGQRREKNWRASNRPQMVFRRDTGFIFASMRWQAQGPQLMWRGTETEEDEYIKARAFFLI